MWDDSPCPSGHNTPFPLKRSPPASFKRLLGGSLTLQILPKAPHQPDVHKTECPVGGRADLVVWLRVRSKLAAPLRASPLLGRRDQRPADTTAAGLGHNEPSLKVGHPIAAAALEIGRASCRERGERSGGP